MNGLYLQSIIFLRVIGTIFFSTFFIITHYIVNTEFYLEQSNLQDFILPAIVSVFVWMMSISYLLLSLVLDDSRKTSRLIYKDQNLETAEDQSRFTIRRTRRASDQCNSSNTKSLHLQVILEAEDKSQERGQTMPPEGMESLKIQPYDKDNEVEVSVIEERDEFWGKSKRLYHFLMESIEYLHPDIYGWRIKFRRLFLTIGTLAFTHTTINTAIVAAQYSSKDEIQKILDYTKTNLTWPDSGSALDDVFELYNSVTKTQSYLMVTACILFWIGLIIDFISHHSANHKIMLYSTSRIANFFGSLVGFASVIVVGLPDYLEASKLDTICLSCSLNFDKTIQLVAEFSIGMIAASVRIILYF